MKDFKELEMIKEIIDDVKGNEITEIWVNGLHSSETRWNNNLEKIVEFVEKIIKENEN